MQVGRTDDAAIMANHEQRILALERRPIPYSVTDSDQFWQGAYFAETCDRTASGMTQVGLAIGSPGGIGYWGINKKFKKGQIFSGIWLFLSQLPTGTPPAEMQILVVDSSYVVRAMSADITALLAAGPLGYISVPFTVDEPLPQDDWVYVAAYSTDDWTSHSPGVQAAIPSIGGATSSSIFSPIDRGYYFGAVPPFTVEDSVPPPTTSASNIPWIATW